MTRINFLLFVCFLGSISYAQAGRSCDVLGGYCPRPVFDNSDQSYCCPSSDGSSRCCTEEDFAITVGAGVVLPIVLGVLSLVVIFICCLCCACCSCCPCYRKRERGAVYGTVPGPSTLVQVTQQLPANIPHSHPQPSYPTQLTSMPQPPPAYTNEVYTKQSPYNPNYPNP